MQPLPTKSAEEKRKCEGCRMVVMGRGDTDGWKGVDGGGGRLIWFCPKPACAQMREELILQRRYEMAGVPQPGRPGTAPRPTKMSLPPRLGTPGHSVDLDLVRTAVQKFLAGDGDQGMVTLAEALGIETSALLPRAKVDHEGPQEGAESAETEPGSQEVHVAEDRPDRPEGPLCGASDGGPVYRPEELPVEAVPCERCLEIWQNRRDGIEDDGVQPADEPEQAMPPVDMDAISMFDPDLIQKVKAGKFTEGYVLIPPTAYPQYDLKVMPLDRLKVGVASLFGRSNYKIGEMFRHEHNEKFVGIAFWLSRS